MGRQRKPVKSQRGAGRGSSTTQQSGNAVDQVAWQHDCTRVPATQDFVGVLLVMRFTQPP